MFEFRRLFRPGLSRQRRGLTGEDSTLLELLDVFPASESLLINGLLARLRSSTAGLVCLADQHARVEAFVAAELAAVQESQLVQVVQLLVQLMKPKKET